MRGYWLLPKIIHASMEVKTKKKEREHTRYTQSCFLFSRWDIFDEDILVHASMIHNYPSCKFSKSLYIYVSEHRETYVLILVTFITIVLLYRSFYPSFLFFFLDSIIYLLYTAIRKDRVKVINPFFSPYLFFEMK